jgi:hypothetical protein
LLLRNLFQKINRSLLLRNLFQKIKMGKWGRLRSKNSHASTYNRNRRHFDEDGIAEKPKSEKPKKVYEPKIPKSRKTCSVKRKLKVSKVKNIRVSRTNFQTGCTEYSRKDYLDIPEKLTYTGTCTHQNDEYSSPIQNALCYIECECPKKIFECNIHGCIRISEFNRSTPIKIEELYKIGYNLRNDLVKENFNSKELKEKSVASKNTDDFDAYVKMVMDEHKFLKPYIEKASVTLMNFY